MNKLFVAIPDGNVKATFLPEHVKEKLEKQFEVTYNETGKNLSKAELKEALQGQHAVMTGWGNCMLDSEVLEGNDSLKLIVHTGGSIGNLVDSYAYDHGITVFSGNIMYAESVAEGVVAYMMLGQRRLFDYISDVRNGGWRTEADCWEGLLDKTVGIVGLGTISTILLSYLKMFRVRVKLYTHYPPSEEFLKENNATLASLEEVFSTCDIVSVHSALNAENRGLIQKEHFDLLKDNALFINTSRGAVIDEEALIDCLKNRNIRAVLDVYNREPLALDSELRSLKNVYCIPHMAGPTQDRREMITSALIEEAAKFFAGEKQSAFEITKEFAKRMTKM